MTDAELRRGFAIAAETKRQDGAGELAEADVLDAIFTKAEPHS